MPWPVKRDYLEVVQFPADCFKDEDLRAATPVLNPSTNSPLYWSGGRGIVFHLRCPGGETVALKCFSVKDQHRNERLAKIATHLKAQKSRLSFTLDEFDFQEEGIFVNGSWYPIVKMSWVEGFTLDKFLEDHKRQRNTLGQLRVMWPKVAANLQETQIAHGDLQHGNIMLVPAEDGKLKLCLVDYDGMYLPQLAAVPSGEKGHLAFQHPERIKKGTYGAEIDKFSHLVIYSSIHALIEGGAGLWKHHGAGDKLLFAQADFEKPAQSAVFRDLWKVKEPGTRALVGRLALACMSPDCTPALKEILLPDGHVRPLSQSEDREAEQVFSGATTTTEVVVVAESEVADPGDYELGFLEETSLEKPVVRRRFFPPRRTPRTPLVWRMFRWFDSWLGYFSGDPGSILHHFFRVIAVVVLVLFTWYAGSASSTALQGMLAARRARWEEHLAEEAQQQADEKKRQEAERTRRKAEVTVDAKRQRALALGKVAEAARRAATAAFQTDLRPAVFRQGEARLAEATQAMERGDFPLAEAAFISAASIFAKSEGEAPALNGLSVAQKAWSDALAAADHTLLQKYAPQEFDAASAQARAAELDRAAEKFSQAWSGYQSAKTLLDIAIARARTERNRNPPAPAAAQEDLVDATQTPPAGSVVTNSIGMRLVLIPAGEFLMGSPGSEGVSDEHPQHRVRINRPFYLGVTEVTQEQYQAVMGSNPSNFQGDTSRPVEKVSWDDATEFCRRLSQKEGKEYHLPTEAQWEYACRAGSTTEWCFGDQENDLVEHAWYNSNSGGSAHPVGQKKPNRWGLYDMHGNVWEWCQDWYEDRYYAESPADDPPGPSSAALRVLRGGSWYNLAANSRSAGRFRLHPDLRFLNYGFRAARTLSTGAAEAKAVTLLTQTQPAASPEPEEKEKTEQDMPTLNADAARTETNTIGMKLVLIPAGEFMMGWPKPGRSDERPQHRVRITRPFYLGVTEVTQAQYQTVVGSNPSSFQGDTSRPVEMVSWDDATEFCRRLSQKEGKEYHLPTEAQWEYACRAGSKMKWCFGGQERDLGEHAWYYGSSSRSTHPVGQKKPNRWSLYDMHGNVREWCQDWYGGDYYAHSPADDPLGPSSSALRVLRGGSWSDNAAESHSARRYWSLPDDRDQHDGFRVARTP